MAPLVLSLAQSESKQRFFERLGLDPHDRVHKRVYALMKLEAAGARKRLLEGQECSTAQIHEVAWQREVLRIYDEACIETKAVYQFGHDTENRTEADNWIIRWLLWQYRDYRNKGRSPTTPALSHASSSYGDDDVDLEIDDEDDTAVEGEQKKKRAFTPPIASTKTIGESEGGTAKASSPSSQYWDPIRERWQR